MGICTINGGGETNIPDIAKLYRDLGKALYAICDHQDDTQKNLIETQVDLLLMHPENDFEDLVLKNTTEEALKRFAENIEWPPHLTAKYPNPELQAREALGEYFDWKKGDWGIADFLAQCAEEEIPQWLREACISLKSVCVPPVAPEEGSTSDNAGNLDIAEKGDSDEVN